MGSLFNLTKKSKEKKWAYEWLNSLTLYEYNNIQTSTKLLEYLALDLKVITTDYKWVRQFENQHDCSFYKLDLSNLDFNIGKLEKHQFKSNFKAEEFLWDNIIEKAGLKKMLLHSKI